MHVIATAGHVDHGKSALVRALTGIEPDRWEEERRRGITLDLGYAWTTLPNGQVVAFVDVPGHERFVTTMLAGVGPVPAALLVVAADEGWMPQTQEHVDALDALAVSAAVVAVSRADLAAPGPVVRQVRGRLRDTTLEQAEIVPVSARTGAGIDDLATALSRLVERLPPPATQADPRLWVDRCFTIAGSGTVVTGTLPSGAIALDDELQVARSGRRVTVRGLQELGQPVRRSLGVARVAINLRGVERSALARGDALHRPGTHRCTATVDARLRRSERPRTPDDTTPQTRLPVQAVLHIGSAATPVRVRLLGGKPPEEVVRLTLATPLPLRIGDRALLRDPGRHLVIGGVLVLDPAPAALTHRGDAARRADELALHDGRPDAAREIERRGITTVEELRALGAPLQQRPVAGHWLLSSAYVAQLRAELNRLIADRAGSESLTAGVPVRVAAAALGLPDVRLIEHIVSAGPTTAGPTTAGPTTSGPTTSGPTKAEPTLVLSAGMVTRPGRAAELPPALESAVSRLEAELRGSFVSPDAERLASLGLGPRQLAAAERAGRLVRLTENVVLLPEALPAAVQVLQQRAEPFTVAEARQALGTTRRVAVPLLELLDRRGWTRRLPDDRRVILDKPGARIDLP